MDGQKIRADDRRRAYGTQTALTTLTFLCGMAAFCIRDMAFILSWLGRLFA